MIVTFSCAAALAAIAMPAAITVERRKVRIGYNLSLESDLRNLLGDAVDAATAGRQCRNVDLRYAPVRECGFHRGLRGFEDQFVQRGRVLQIGRGRRLVVADDDRSAARRFSLFLVDENGENLERVTFSDEFDSFPMFSPDGKYLVWASNRLNKKEGETNLFLAEWVD